MKNRNISVQFTKPEEEIKRLLEKAGAKDVRYSTSFSGANFNYRLDDLVDEREFERRIKTQIREAGYKTSEQSIRRPNAFKSEEK